MTTEQKYQVGRGIGLVISIGIDIGLAYFIGKHFHSALAGWATYFVLARLTGVQDTVNEIKRSLK